MKAFDSMKDCCDQPVWNPLLYRNQLVQMRMLAADTRLYGSIVWTRLFHSFSIDPLQCFIASMGIDAYCSPYPYVTRDSFDLHKCTGVASVL